MAENDFYRQNQGRDYPLQKGLTNRLEGSAVLFAPMPYEVLCDFGCILGPGAGFTTGTDKVYLQKIARDSDGFTFDFRISSSADYRFLFKRGASDPRFTTELVAATEIATGDENPDIGEAYLVTGDLDWLVDRLSQGNSIEETTGLYAVEDSLVQNLGTDRVLAIDVYNLERQRATAPSGCEPIDWAFELQDIYEVETGLTGDVRLGAGYNAEIYVDRTANRLRLRAGVGLGKGEPCRGPALASVEAEAIPSGPFDGAVECGDVIRFVSGAPGPNVVIRAGQAVRITPKPSGHEIEIDIRSDDVFEADEE